MALQPHRSADYRDIRTWMDLGSVRPYDGADLDVDYPPQAFFVILPLVSLPRGSAPAILAVLNVGFSIAMAWLFVRVTAGLAGVSPGQFETGALTAMTLCFGAVRCAIWLGQTMPLALALLLIGVRFARTRPFLAGICLALGGFKLNILAGLIPALILDSAWPALMVAAVTSVALAMAAAPVIGYSFMAILPAYLNALRRDYAGADFYHGSTDVRSLLHLLIANHAAAEVLWLIVAIGSLAWLWLAARRAPKTPRTRAIVFAASLTWSLLAFYNLRYNLVLLAPAILVLGWPEMHVIDNGRLRRGLLAGLLLFLVLDMPLLLRLWAPSLPWLDGRELMEVTSVYTSIPTRLVVLGLFALLVARVTRPMPVPFP
jgi:hypothetical protein